MQVRDISDPITWTINVLFQLIGQVFGLMDSIRFSGISLLDFLITLAILSVVIPLLFARLKATPKAERGKSDEDNS